MRNPDGASHQIPEEAHHPRAFHQTVSRPTPLHPSPLLIVPGSGFTPQLNISC